MDREEERLLCSHCPFGRRCDSPPGALAVFPDIDETRSFRIDCCPRKHARTEPLPTGDPFGHYRRLETGVLPIAGGWLDQPQLFVETVALLDALVDESRRRWRRRREEQNRQIDDLSKTPNALRGF